MQASRRRPHYEVAIAVAREARCWMCHRLALEVGDGYAIDQRGRRYCLPCVALDRSEPWPPSSS